MMSITRSPTCECELVVVEVVVESLLKDTVSVRGQGNNFMSVLVRRSPEDDWKLERGRPKAYIIHTTYTTITAEPSTGSISYYHE